MSEQALTDLKFLGQRLKGVIEIVPQLEQIQSLTDHIASMEGVLQAQKTEYAERKAAFDALEKDETAFEKQKETILKNARNEAERLLAKANKEYEDVLISASRNAEEVKAEALRVKQTLIKEIEALNQSRIMIVEEIKKLSAQLHSLKAELENLKSRF